MDPAYFNYDDESEFGPHNWGSVVNHYWTEFDKDGFGAWNGYLRTRQPSLNTCTTGTQQSPIDLTASGSECGETHEVRDHPGDYPVTSSAIQKNILSNKLQLNYPRRSCDDFQKCSTPDPPYADFPNGWFSMADLLSIDIKIPSEHVVEGKRYAAEMQTFHLHPLRRRIAAWSVLIQAEPGPDSYNYYFDEALKTFQSEYDKNQEMCRQTRMQAGVNLTALVNMTAVTPDSAAEALNGTHRHLQQQQFIAGSVWNPYHEMLIPTIHFWRYDGSLTDPPCGEFVSWFVADTPMIISQAQLFQMQRILFTNVDSNCRMTSVRQDRSVARPIQPSNNRDVALCTRHDFGPDPR
jgi:carbonic anhydrase